MPTIAGRTRPIERFAEAAAKCSAEAASYGKCIVADYQSVHQDMCAKEFMRLKDCYLVQMTTHAYANVDLLLESRKEAVAIGILSRKNPVDLAI